MFYINLVGGLITCQFPYVFIVLFGWYFSKLHALEKDMAKPLAKTVIFIFLPCYYFIWIGKTISITNLSNYYIIIVSDLIKTIFALILTYTYTSITNMDYRYKYTWIALGTFQDVRYLNQTLVNTFCYNLNSKLQKEIDFCTTNTTFSFIHLFFHQVILWYVIFNFIRRDKINIVAVSKVGENIEIKDSPEVVPTEETTENHELALKFKKYRRNEDNELYVSNSFSLKAGKYYEKHLKIENQSLFSSIIYIFFQPVIIAIFCGFILGFITTVKNWWYNPKSSVVLFVDTLTSIGNANIVCGYLIIGVNLYYNEKEKYDARFSKMEYLVLLFLKCILLPFCGLIFVGIAREYIDNTPVLFAAYIQWFMPSSQDILIICQSKSISTFSVSVFILIQYIYMFVFNNFIIMVPLLKILNLL